MTSEYKTREQAYDECIAPLMAQVIAHCNAHDIPLAAQFQIDDERGKEEPFYCTTLVLPEDSAPQLKKIGLTMKPPPPAWGAFMTVDGVTTQLAGSNMPWKKP